MKFDYQEFIYKLLMLTIAKKVKILNSPQFWCKRITFE